MKNQPPERHPWKNSPFFQQPASGGVLGATVRAASGLGGPDGSEFQCGGVARLGDTVGVVLCRLFWLGVFPSYLTLPVYLLTGALYLGLAKWLNRPESVPVGR